MRSEIFVALTADGTEFDEALHRRRDIEADEVSSVEPESAGRKVIALVTDTQDPGLAMIAAGITWAIVSRELSDGSLVCIGRGFVDPDAIQSQDEDTVSVEVTCSPRDWDTPQAAALAPMKVLPFFDPMLVDPASRDDPLEILDGYSRVVHCHPVTHEFTTVDIHGVGLPLVTVTDPDWPGPKADATARPISRIDVAVRAEFIERRDGIIPLTEIVEAEFDEGIPNTLSPDAFESSFFPVGSTLNGDSGYTFTKSMLTKFQPEDEILYPRKAGKVRGSDGTYNYIEDEDVTVEAPVEFDLDRVWYRAVLEMSWAIRQKRSETVRFSIFNGAPGAAGGAVEKLELQCEDVSLDDVTPEWLPLTPYDENDVIRIANRNWRCTVTHVSKATFAVDLFDIADGIAFQRWVLLASDASPIGGSTATSYFLQPRGRQTMHAAALKARAVLASSIRNKVYRFETEVTDGLLTLTTAARVRVRCPDQPSGWLEAKVTEVELISNSDDEYMAITVSPAGGSGLAVDGVAVSQTGEDWDRLLFGEYDEQQPTPFPPITGTIAVFFQPADQLEYIQERDFLPSAGRDDPEANDPMELLKQRVTTVQITMTQIAGRDDFEHFIDVPVLHPWSGPKQHGGA